MIIYVQKFKGKVAGFSVKAVDTTGAGDSFVGSFLLSMANDMSIFEVITFSPNLDTFYFLVSIFCVLKF